jgi:hypothetical protein
MVTGMLSSATMRRIRFLIVVGLMSPGSVMREAVWVWYGKPYVLLQDASASAHPSTLWRTILTAWPYPVRALFVWASNVLGCYPNPPTGL